MAKVRLIVEDLDDGNVVVSLDGETGNPLDPDAPSLTSAQRLAWSAFNFFQTQTGRAEETKVEE